MTFLQKLFNRKGKEINKLKQSIIRERKKDITSLKTVNKQVKLLLEEGSIEVVIKNVKGVVKEL